MLNLGQKCLVTSCQLTANKLDLRIINKSILLIEVKDNNTIIFKMIVIFSFGLHFTFYIVTKFNAY